MVLFVPGTTAKPKDHLRIIHSASAALGRGGAAEGARGERSHRTGLSPGEVPGGLRRWDSSPAWKLGANWEQKGCPGDEERG